MRAPARPAGPAVHPGVRRRFVVVDDPRWAQAHGSTVCAVPGGGLLVAWFAGTREGAADTNVWLARRAVGEQAWSAPEVVLDGAEAHWNPVLAPGPDGDVWLFAKRGPLISRWTTWTTRSADGGRTWQPPRELVPDDRGGRGPVRNPPLLLPDGSWLAPGSVEQWDPEPRWDAFVDVSTDRGASWRRIAVPLDHDHLAGAGVIQPSLWSGRGQVVALLRSSEGRAYRSTSRDGGLSWSPAEPTGLPNNNSGLAALALEDGRVVCAHNPTSGDWGARCPLVLSVSHDDGLSWRQVAVLEDGRTPVDDDPAHRPAEPAAEAFAPADGGVGTSGVGEYSYPALTVADGSLVVTYTWQRRGVVEATVPLAELMDPLPPEELP